MAKRRRKRWDSRWEPHASVVPASYTLSQTQLTAQRSGGMSVFGPPSCSADRATHRAYIEQRVAKQEGMTLIFLESLCDDPATIAANVALKVSMGDPDYKDTSPEDAKRDFLRRIKAYEAVYETITEPHLSYFKIINESHRVLPHEFALEAAQYILFQSMLRIVPTENRLNLMLSSTARASSTWRGK